MACPFAQLSPLLLLSFLALFFQFGASFFSPKPLLASIHRGRWLTGPSRKASGAPSPHGSGGGKDGESGGRRGAGGPRLLGISGSVLAAPETEVEQEEDLLDNPLPWDTALSTGNPLLYSNMFRHQAISLQIGLGLDRIPCPRGMSTISNPDKQARVRNVLYSGGRVRKLRMSYLDTPGMQVCTSLAYSTGGHDFPLLGLSSMAMGRVRIVAMDLQPLFQGAEYTAKYAKYMERFAALRAKYPQLCHDLKGDYYKDSPFFSNNMLLARYGPEEEASGFMESVILPAFRECIDTYIDLVNEADEPAHARGSPEEEAILARQAEFDRFHAAREQARPVMTANFGATLAEQYLAKFLFSYGSEDR